MRTEMLSSILSELKGTSTDIEAVAIISTDGLVISALLPREIDEDRVGAMSATMLSLGTRTAKELSLGNLEQVLVKGDNGYIIMVGTGEHSVLAVVTKSSAKLGLIFLDVKRAVEEIKPLI